MFCSQDAMDTDVSTGRDGRQKTDRQIGTGQAVDRQAVDRQAVDRQAVS